MVPMKFHILSILVVLFFQSIAPALAESSSGLVEAPSAVEVRRSERKNIKDIFYKVHEVYPAKATLGFIKTKLESTGWVPLAEDYLNPDLASSHAGGWDAEFTDETKSPRQDVVQWLAQWQDKLGNIAQYSLQYRNDEGKPRNREVVEVIGSVLPMEVVLKMNERTVATTGGGQKTAK